MQRKIHLQSLLALSIFGLIFVAPVSSFSQGYELADQYWQQANTLSKQGQYLEAARMYEKSVAVEQAGPEPRQTKLTAALTEAGYYYFQVGQYDKALDFFQQTLEIFKRLGKEADIAINLNNIGSVYKSRGQYDKAIGFYQMALEIGKRLGKEADIAINLSNIGTVYYYRGQYDKAIDFFKQALEIARKLGMEAELARDLNNVGVVYKSWGQYDRAIEFYQQALEIDKRLGKEPELARDLNNIGMLYKSRDQYEKAIEFYQQSLEIVRRLGMEAEIGITLINIGGVYNARGQYEKAIEFYQQALEIDKRLGMESEVATNLNNIGMIYDSRGQFDKALDFYQQALQIVRRLGKEAYIAAVLNNIGFIYGSLGQFDKAIEHFRQSIQLLEKIRRTASGGIRRDYLSSQIATYQALASAYLKQDDPRGVLGAIEQSRARLLAERIAGTDSKQELQTLEEVQKNLTGDEAVLLFSNIDKDDFILMVITAREVAMQEIAKESFLARSQKLYKKPTLMLLEKQRGLSFIENSGKANNRSLEEQKQQADFEISIHYYRSLLTNPNHQEEAREFGRLLHALLIEPVSRKLAGKHNITIMPDGILGYFPFETLVNDSNNYLAQEYNLRYTQSLTIDKLLQRRDYTKKKVRKAMLAMGGAVYDEAYYENERVDNSKQRLAWLQQETDRAIEEKRSARSSYARLGMASWSNLPGTLEEVNKLSAIIKDGDILIGDKVTESRIKQYSKSGKLAEYKVLHFATHGLVVPEIPELSALVLSQFKQEKDGEDGYLRMGEIAKLDLDADFVNLSACETGLGKIYGGEGIVGLTQAFLIAGSNGLSVSLWQVADDSTAKFMTRLYSKVQDTGMGYNQALTEVKREFINGDYGEKWRAPYYWSPFVYYGN